MANIMSKTRPASNPYMTVEYGTWTWRILKVYKTDLRAPYALVFCDVSSPGTMGGSDMGDVYVSEILDVIRRGGVITGDPQCVALWGAAL